MKNNKIIIKWAILFSGGGNSILECFKHYSAGTLKNNQITCIVSVGQQSPALKIAKELNIKTIEIDPRKYANIEEYQRDLADMLSALEIDYIYLLGYKYRIRSYMLKAFTDRIINVHPSLLPSFKNTQSAIQDAMNYGVKLTGSTTHIIDDQIDEGIILQQKAIRIEENDDFTSVYEKFLKIGADLICETFLLVEKKHKPNSYLKLYLRSLKLIK